MAFRLGEKAARYGPIPRDGLRSRSGAKGGGRSGNSRCPFSRNIGRWGKGVRALKVHAGGAGLYRAGADAVGMFRMDAVAFCIFNRPEPTARVFAEIRKERPRRLLVIGDGPRSDRPGDAALVRATREIVGGVDWPCDVEYCFSDINLGCRDRISSGLSWAFERAESLVVLEDDCLPGGDFFPFMRELLGRYRDDQRVMMISGDFFLGAPQSADSYYFSRWTHIWGWGTWRRAWRHFDPAIRSWPLIRPTAALAHAVDGADEESHWRQVFDQVHDGAIDTWDFSWQFACWMQGGLAVLPNVNLVTNIGFGADATHTVDARSPLAGMPAGRLGMLRHPNAMVRNRDADRMTWERIFRPSPAAMPASRRRSAKLPWPWRKAAG